jgi:UDP-N-acetyl-D-mannosaminuronic acid dehydrogenase
VGGHCISVDPWFFVEAAPDITQLIRSARNVNDGQPGFVVEKIRGLLGDITGKKIAALGLAYKPDVDDLRESPAIEVVQLLSKAGALVTAYEPFKPDFQIAPAIMAKNLDGALQDADLILLLVNHKQFTEIDPKQIINRTKARIIFDTVGGWNPDIWKAAGFEIHRLGVSKGNWHHDG